MSVIFFVFWMGQQAKIVWYEVRNVQIKFITCQKTDPLLMALCPISIGRVNGPYLSGNENVTGEACEKVLRYFALLKLQ